MTTAQLRVFFDRVDADDALRAQLDAHLSLNGNAADSLIAFARGAGCKVSIDDLRHTVPLPGMLADAELDNTPTLTPARMHAYNRAARVLTPTASRYLNRLTWPCIGIPTD